MKQFLLATLTAIFTAIPAGAKPFPVVNPAERMVVVPGLEFLGASRISTVSHCMEITGVQSWENLLTDSDFVNFESCLREHT